ncbi:hypothetical protein E4U54_007734 [Claviceps lovelessii]|nr:hypothetical protein E4U54_007734 [Claviceps lovelessii]
MAPAGWRVETPLGLIDQSVNVSVPVQAAAVLVRKLWVEQRPVLVQDSPADQQEVTLSDVCS